MLKHLLLLTSFVFLAACSSPNSTFYVLNGTSPLPKGKMQHYKSTQKVAIGPVSIANYLDRPQIVTRTASNELKLDEFNRWAEPLNQNIQQVLLNDLSQQLPRTQFYPYPQYRNIPVRYRLAIDISRADTDAQGNSVLISDITVFSGKTHQVLHKYQVEFSKNIGPNYTYPQAVSAMNKNVNRLSRFIAKKIR